MKFGKHFEIWCAKGDPMDVHYVGGSPPQLRVVCEACGIDSTLILDRAFGFPVEPDRTAERRPSTPTPADSRGRTTVDQLRSGL